MGGQNSDSDFLVPAWNFANNIAAIANYPKVIGFFPVEMSSRYKKIWVAKTLIVIFLCQHGTLQTTLLQLPTAQKL